MAGMSDERPLVPNPAALDFLLTRRSRPPRLLGIRRPDDASLRTLLTAAARVPDHGKLVPWRFLVLEPAACRRLAGLVRTLGAERGEEAERIGKVSTGFEDAGLIVAIVSSPVLHPAIPLGEQQASAAAVCLSLVNASLAAGWGASWITGWCATDPAFLTQGLALFPGETVAGYIHIGDEARPPADRPRPDIDALTTWVRA